MKDMIRFRSAVRDAGVDEVEEVGEGKRESVAERFASAIRGWPEQVRTYKVSGVRFEWWEVCCADDCGQGATVYEDVLVPYLESK